MRPRVGRLADPAGVHHGDAVRHARHHAHVVRSPGSSTCAAAACSSASRSRICAWIVTSSAVVGSSASTQRRVAEQGAGDADALLHAAAQLVRVLPQPGRRVGDADQPQQLGDPVGASACLRQIRSCQTQDLRQLRADGEDRVERGGRVLEDHGDAAPAHCGSSPRAGMGQQVLALEHARGRRRSAPAAAPGAAGRGWTLSCRCRTSPTMPSVSAGPTPKSTPSTARTTPSRVRKWTAAPPPRAAAPGYWRRRGLKASVSPSASRLKPSTVRKIAAAGRQRGPGRHLQRLVVEVQQLAPGDRLRVAEAEEAHHRLGQDRAADAERHQHDQRRQGVGQDVPEQDVAPGGADAVRGLDELGVLAGAGTRPAPCARSAASRTGRAAR